MWKLWVVGAVVKGGEWGVLCKGRGGGLEMNVLFTNSVVCAGNAVAPAVQYGDAIVRP